MMIEQEKQEIIQAFVHHLQSKDYPCIAAHDVASKQALSCFVADHMACPKDDRDILNFIYSFVDKYRTSTKGYHSVAILFKEPSNLSEEEFDTLLWMRLQSLSDLDAQQYKYDARVASDVTSPHFSFSLKEEAFYIIGLHPSSQRNSRKFSYPVLVFNPHAQFERLREQQHYQKMQHIVRERDKAYSGNVNPMLADFGQSPEVIQYSGRTYDENWKCPLILKHAGIKHHPAT